MRSGRALTRALGSKLNFVDISKRIGKPQIQQTFVLAVGYPTPEKLEAVASRYASDPTWSALALFDEADLP